MRAGLRLARTRPKAMRRLLKYFVKEWIPAFAHDWLAEGRPEDNQQEWLEAAMVQSVDKFLSLMEKRMAWYDGDNQDKRNAQETILWLILIGFGLFLGWLIF